MFRLLGDFPVQSPTDDETEAQREAVSYVKSQSKSTVDLLFLFLLDQLLPDNGQEGIGFRVKIIIMLPTLNLYLTVSPNFLRIMSIK